MTDELSFQLEEYKALRKEVEIYEQESRSQERYTLIAVGLTWYWLLTNHLTIGLLWFVPILLTAATTARMVAMMRHFKNLGSYLAKLEDVFIGAQGKSEKDPRGWEHMPKRKSLGLAYGIIDGALLLLTIIGWWYRVAIVSQVPTACKG
jgi:hypothetical protein